MPNVGNPTLKQLQYLDAVAQAGSFRAAAQKLGVSQPTITSQIAALEEALGMTLLERSRTGALPSSAGRALLPHIATIREAVGAIRDHARFVGDGGSGIHRLGAPPTLGPYLLPDVLTAIHAKDPSLRLYVREDTPRDLENALVSGRYDLILTVRPVEISELEVDPLFGEPFQLCAPPDHPLVERGTVEANALAGERLLAIDERFRLFEQMQALANRYGASLLRDYEGSSLDTVRQMIATGFGLAFLPSLYVRSEIEPRDDVVVLAMEDEPLDREVVLAWRPTAPHRAMYRKLAEQIRAVCQAKLAPYIHLSTAP